MEEKRKRGNVINYDWMMKIKQKYVNLDKNNHVKIKNDIHNGCK